MRSENPRVRRRGARPAGAPQDSASYARTLSQAAQAQELRKTERTRLRLLAAAADCLERGLEHTQLRVSDVAHGAGIALGTFYRYFEDRPMIVQALMGEFTGFLSERLSSVRGGPPGSADQVRAVTLAYVRLFRANTGLMQCLTGTGPESLPFRDPFHALNREWNGRVAAALASHRRRKRGIAVSARRMLPLAYALGGMIDEFLAQIYLRRDPALAELRDDEEKIADLLTELWWGAAYGEPL
jgi:AcrR family transcriptional regulator